MVQNLNKGVSAIATHAFLEFEVGKLIHELGEDCLADVHVPLSSDVSALGEAQFDLGSAGKKLKSKKLDSRLNCS